MSGPSGRFDPSELHLPGEPDASAAELAGALPAARELEALVAGATVRPTDGFEDRVMAAIAREPVPRLAVRPGSAVRGGIAASFLMTLRDAWGVATTGGRPIAVRAQALALVLLIVVATTALAGVGAATVGGLLDRGRSPAQSVAPAPTVEPTPTGPTTSIEPTPSESAEPSESSEASETPGASESQEPTETIEPADTARPTRTLQPTETPDPGETDKPGETPTGSDDHSGSGSDGG